MKHLLSSAFLALSLLAAAPHEVSAQQQQQAAAATKLSASAPPVDAEKVIRAFSAKETEFQRALREYGFKRDAVIQTIGLGGQISGEYRRVSRFVMDDSGKRFEKILFSPMSTLQELQISPSDIEDLGGVNAFALESSKIAQYNFTYVGKERIDELNLYTFDVAPKVMPDPKKSKERFFQGRIWVDDQDLQIVSRAAKASPNRRTTEAHFRDFPRAGWGRYGSRPTPTPTKKSF